MKTILVLALIFAVALSFPRKGFVSTADVFAEISKEQFGATMISAIQLQIRAGGEQEEIILLIEEIIKQVKNEQQSADEKNITDQVFCDTNIGAFTQQVLDLESQITYLETSIKDNDEILAQAKVDLAQTIQDYEDTVSRIITGTQEREQQHALWADADYQQQIDIATLEEGVKLINHMIHGVVFSQLQGRYNKVLEVLKSSKSLHANLYKPIIVSLTELATKLNYENVMKILELLNNIRNSIVEEREIGRIQEEQSQSDWEILLAHLEQQKQSLADKRLRLTALIESTTNLLEQLHSSLDQAIKNLDNTRILLAETQTQCESWTTFYTTSSSERGRELEILERLLTHLNDRFSAVSQYAQSRSE